MSHKYMKEKVFSSAYQTKETNLVYFCGLKEI